MTGDWGRRRPARGGWAPRARRPRRRRSRLLAVLLVTANARRPRPVLHLGAASASDAVHRPRDAAFADLGLDADLAAQVPEVADEGEVERAVAPPELGKATAAVTAVTTAPMIMARTTALAVGVLGARDHGGGLWVEAAAARTVTAPWRRRSRPRSCRGPVRQSPRPHPRHPPRARRWLRQPILPPKSSTECVRSCMSASSASIIGAGAASLPPLRTTLAPARVRGSCHLLALPHDHGHEHDEPCHHERDHDQRARHAPTPPPDATILQRSHATLVTTVTPVSEARRRCATM